MIVWVTHKWDLDLTARKPTKVDPVPQRGGPPIGSLNESHSDGWSR